MAISSIGYRTDGSSDGQTTLSADRIAAALRTVNSSGSSTVQAESKTLFSGTGTIIYDVDYLNVNIMVVSTGYAMVGTCRGTSLAEARKISDRELFLNDINTRRNLQSISNNFMTARLLEIDGANIIEPTAFEPDPNTYRNKYYYNAISNTLYMKMINRQEPGLVVAYWKKVSQ